MCSIAGIINFRRNTEQRHIIKKMCDITSHRGPDGEGYLFFNRSKGTYLQTKNVNDPKTYAISDLAFGHRRLKIIDLTERGDQPMSNEDGTLWIVQNGEIYNYLELKEELRSKNHIFKSDSDTEVIIHAYEEYGENCLDKLNGMWAFAIFDTKRKLLFCSRDRLGKKPFFYYYNGEIFIFSSEIKAILASGLVENKPNYKAVFSYLVREIGFTSYTGETFFDKIQQLKPAHYLILTNQGLKIKEYWRIPFDETKSESPEILTEKFLTLFKDAVRIRLRSDVPISSYLSGGLDTSSVVVTVKSLLGRNRLTTFSSCFNEPAYDERPYIEEIAKRCELKPVYIFPAPEKLVRELDVLIWHQEEPFLHLNVYAQWQIMRSIAERRFRVVLNGHGGDEGLAGYTKDFAFYLADLLRHFQLKDYYKELQSFNGKVYNIPRRSLFFDSLRISCSEKVPSTVKNYFKQYTAKVNILKKEFTQAFSAHINLKDVPIGFLKRSSYMGYKIYPVPEWLKYEDRASMAHSVESC